jgi:hypothetical protein
MGIEVRRPARENIGLEWESCHQLAYLIDPIPQIHKWAPKFFRVHGKDVTIRWDIVKTHGVFGKYPFVQMRTRVSATPTGPASSASCGSRAIRQHRHRGLARSGLSRGARNDGTSQRARLSQDVSRRRGIRSQSGVMDVIASKAKQSRLSGSRKLVSTPLAAEFSESAGSLRGRLKPWPKALWESRSLDCFALLAMTDTRARQAAADTGAGRLRLMAAADSTRL